MLRTHVGMYLICILLMLLSLPSLYIAIDKPQTTPLLIGNTLMVYRNAMAARV